MKSRDIQRSIHAQRLERSAGDAPGIGKVARVPGRFGGKKRRRRGSHADGRSRRGESRGLARRVVKNWSLFLAGLVIMVLIGFLWLWVSSMMRKSSATDGANVAASPPVQLRVESRFPSPSKDESLAIVKKALAIRIPSAVGELFHTGSVSPEDVVGFLVDLEKTDGKVMDYKWLSSIDANGLLLEGVMLESVKDSEHRSRIAFLTPDGFGRWKIDYESFARTARPSWEELLEKNAGQATVRVFIGKDNYFNGPFSDESQWVCYGLASPDTSEILMGYCKMDSPQAKALARISSDVIEDPVGGKFSRVTLEIRRREGAEKRQFEITRVLAEDWVLSPKPFEDNFK
jgi:hypothetical protein